jgi:hypothetical protein
MKKKNIFHLEKSNFLSVFQHILASVRILAVLPASASTCQHLQEPINTYTILQHLFVAASVCQDLPACDIPSSCQCLSASVIDLLLVALCCDT